MNNELMFSSKTDMWATPQAFFDKLHAVFRFETDVCALPDNAKCETYYTPDKDGLAQDWKGTCWMNPPYGREISAWVQKAYRSAKENGATVVCLLPARVDTRWWHDYCANGEVFFVRGRLKFGGAENSAPFPNAVVVFRPTVHDALKVGAGDTAKLLLDAALDELDDLENRTRTREENIALVASLVMDYNSRLRKHMKAEEERKKLHQEQRVLL
jgi:phage N-6-adenine-methyltransferase